MISNVMEGSFCPELAWVVFSLLACSVDGALHDTRIKKQTVKRDKLSFKVCGFSFKKYTRHARIG